MFKIGDLVEHADPAVDWGIGEVIEAVTIQRRKGSSIEYGIQWNKKGRVDYRRETALRLIPGFNDILKGML